MYYRNEIEKVKKSLERDNMIAMESMKNKMREMAKAHSTAMSALSRQYKDEIDEIRDRSAEKHLSDTEVQVRPYINISTLKKKSADYYISFGFRKCFF